MKIELDHVLIMQQQNEVSIYTYNFFDNIRSTYLHIWKIARS